METRFCLVIQNQVFFQNQVKINSAMHEIASNHFYYKSEMKTRTTQESGYNVYGEMVLDFVERKTHHVRLFEGFGCRA